MAKLTLNINPHIVEAAKGYAERHGTSLSKLVARFFISLGNEPKDTFFEDLHAEILREGFQAPGGDIAGLRQQHVRKKYL